MLARQKVTKYPGQDLTVIRWIGVPETPTSQKDIYKDTMLKLTESYIYDRRIGKREFLRQLNQLVSRYKIS